MMRIPIFVAFISMAVGACVVDRVQAGSAGEAGVPTFSVAEGERQMAAFDRANPQCQAWSNWRKSCSRSGPNGSTYCWSDPHREVAPSAPFCATGPESNANNQSATELASNDRFCEAWETYGRFGAEGELPPVRECVRFRPDRPFNGRRLAAVVHPWCEAWRDPYTLAPVCSSRRDPPAGVPSCSLLVRRGYVHPNAMECAGWTPSVPCLRPAPSWEREVRNGNIVLPAPPRPRGEGTAIYAVRCADEE